MDIDGSRRSTYDPIKEEGTETELLDGGIDYESNPVQLFG